MHKGDIRLCPELKPCSVELMSGLDVPPPYVPACKRLGGGYFLSLRIRLGSSGVRLLVVAHAKRIIAMAAVQSVRSHRIVFLFVQHSHPVLHKSL